MPDIWLETSRTSYKVESSMHIIVSSSIIAQASLLVAMIRLISSLITAGKLFILIIKAVGPTLLPWGTPPLMTRRPDVAYVAIIILFIEQLVRNATIFVRSGPTAVVGIMNASKTSTSSRMTLEINQTSVPHLHSSVSGMITIFVFLSLSLSLK